jgi:hypothetical protein
MSHFGVSEYNRKCAANASPSEAGKRLEECGQEARREHPSRCSRMSTRINIHDEKTERIALKKEE